MDIKKLKEKIRKSEDGRERRKFEAGFEIRAGDDDGPPMLKGYAARFNVWSEDLEYFVERIRPGAFKKALMTSDVRALYNHNSDQLPLGRTPKTLRLAEDTKGLKMENDLPVDPETNALTQFANDLVISINRGDVTQMSFGFNVSEDGDEWHEKDGIVRRTIHEFNELFDVSPVVYPAYKSTKISVRTLEKLENHKSAETRRENEAETRLEDEQKNLEIDLLTINRAEDLK